MEEPHPAQVYVLRTLGEEGLATESLDLETKPRQCKCKHSSCLKLYCECFNHRTYCVGCSCTNCLNTPMHRAEIEKAVQKTVERNPRAFKPKVISSDNTAKTGGEKVHIAGCRCKKTNCLKKYCECFQANVFCGENCQCSDCKNTPEGAERKYQQQMQDSSPGSHHHHQSAKSPLINKDRSPPVLMKSKSTNSGGVLFSSRGLNLPPTDSGPDGQGGQTLSEITSPQPTSLISSDESRIPHQRGRFHTITKAEDLSSLCQALVISGDDPDSSHPGGGGGGNISSKSTTSSPTRPSGEHHTTEEVLIELSGILKKSTLIGVNQESGKKMIMLKKPHMSPRFSPYPNPSSPPSFQSPGGSPAARYSPYNHYSSPHLHSSPHVHNSHFPSPHHNPPHSSQMHPLQSPYSSPILHPSSHPNSRTSTPPNFDGRGKMQEDLYPKSYSPSHPNHASLVQFNKTYGKAPPPRHASYGGAGSLGAFRTQHNLQNDSMDWN